jgi:small multidrug resistance family-3 protein
LRNLFVGILHSTDDHTRAGQQHKEALMFEIKTVVLFILTAVAEIVGCYLPYLWLRQSASIWVLLPAAISLGLFVWLLSLHPAAAGRVYAAYGGVYVVVALGWLWLVDGLRPTAWDLIGAAAMLAGMGIIMFAPRHA